MDKIEFHTESRKIADLIPYEHNPRKMSEEQSKHLTESLSKFNLASIPVINTDNLIISGHQRMRILQALGRGQETIDVRVPNRKLTDKEMQELNVRENKNLGDWDFDVLANAFDVEMLQEIGFKEFEMGMFDAVGMDEQGKLDQKLETEIICPNCSHKFVK